MRRFLLALVVLLLVCSTGVAYAAPGDERWESMNSEVPGTNGYPLAMLRSGDYLYMGGSFTFVKDTWAHHVARLHIPTGTWESLGEGVNDDVLALALDANGNLYVGGDFTEAGGISANRVAKWDGTSWSALGDGVDARVWALAADSNGTIYAGGKFSTAGGIAAGNLAKWDGSFWSDMGEIVYEAEGYEDSRAIFALAVDADNTLYAGGYFTSIDGVAAGGVARWDGLSWHAMGKGIGNVRAFAIDADGVIFAGSVNISDNLARWDGTSWMSLGGNSMYGSVLALALDDNGNLYVGGVFPDYIVKIGVGTSLEYISGPVYALAVDASGNLYAGGRFYRAGAVKANHIAKWDGTAWSALESAVDTTIFDLAIDAQDALYAGGYFTELGGVAANNIAQWTGTAWQALGSGTNGRVTALAADTEGNLYVGGGFSTAGGVAVNNVASWDGTTWSALGDGLSGEVFDLAVSKQGHLYAVAYGDLFLWNGTAWDYIENGIDGYFYALAVTIGGGLYAGGSIDNPGSGACVAVKTYSSWDIIGSGSGGLEYVLSLIADLQGGVYAGGSFSMMGEATANNIAKWDGTSWSALGSGLKDPYWAEVHSFVFDAKENLYAGGMFSTAGDMPSNNIAMWDGMLWSTLGSGVDDIVLAQVVDKQGNLYVGGQFTFAGGTVSHGIAKYRTGNGIPDDDDLDDSDTIGPADEDMLFDDTDDPIADIDTLQPDEAADEATDSTIDSIIPDESTPVDTEKVLPKDDGCGCSILF